MTRFMTRLRRPLAPAAISALLLALASAGASAAKQGWYQVELIVFKRLSYNQIEHPNRPGELQLAYPYRLKQLLSQADQDLQADPGSGLRQGSFLRPLPPQARLLAGPANALARSRNQRVLFHQSWNQQLGAKPLAIAIDGGQQYGQRHELQGHIKLSLSRYLHLDSDLWLSRFGAAEPGQLGAQFALPQPPTLLPRPFNAAPAPAAQFSKASLRADGTLAPVLQSAEQSDGYRVLSVDQLKESRTMRSGELHYLDHPAFGILIKLEAIEPPQWPYDNRIKSNRIEPAPGKPTGPAGEQIETLQTSAG